MLSRFTAFTAIATIAAGFASTLAQPCPDWNATPIGNPGIVGVVNSMVVYDDGSGPAVYASGSFTGAGGGIADAIARWDGSRWTDVGGGLIGASRVRAPGLAVYDDGTGPGLYACGNFNFAGTVEAWGIARWDGTAWSALGDGLINDPFGAPRNGMGFKMAVYNDGTGEKLYVGGVFETAGVLPSARNIASWDGTSWARVVGDADASVNFLLAHDDGSGEALFVGGNMSSMAGVPVSGIAKFDGTNWSSPGTGVSGGLGRVNGLGAFDDGRGRRLYVVGSFDFAGGISVENMAAWNGSGWERLPVTGINDTAGALATYDDGSGEALYVGGFFTTAGGAPASQIAKYDGTTWHPLGTGVFGASFPNVSALCTWDDGSGESLYVGGGFEMAGGQVAESIAQWNGCPICYADCDQSTGPGILDVFDFLCFQDAFVAGDPYACDCDVTAVGVCNIFDFLCFQDAFVAGCP